VTKDEVDEIDAWVMAQSFVEDRLRSPGTADFGGVFAGDYQDPMECVGKTGPNAYRVTGWVDAQNALGATVRADFVCELEYQGDDMWHCNSLEIEQR